MAGENDGNKWRTVLVAVIGAAIGGSGTVAIYLGTPLAQEAVRPDPFTGTEAAELKREIRYLREELRRHTDMHPDVAKRFDERLNNLEAQMQYHDHDEQR